MHQPDVGTLVAATYGTETYGVGTTAPVAAGGPRIEPVPISSLTSGESPRSQGIDQEHVARLVDLDVPLPPILVRRSDMCVIDGMHRLLAAHIQGQESIDVEFFEGSAEDAFLRGVEANVAHGLPLSLADRRAAASRIIVAHPQMSDRAIARASGLGAKAVAAIRRRSTDAEQQLNVRIGRDGRVRPLNSVEGRWRAAAVMVEKPEASLREVARIAGISPATAGDVRKRIRAGELPAAIRPQAAGVDEDSALEQTTSAPQGEAWASSSAQGRCRARPAQPNSDLMLEKLMKDPSLRLKEDGRVLLRLLQQNAIAAWSGLSAVVPPHCETLVGSLARQYANSWLEFAQRLEVREGLSLQRETS